MSIVTEKIRLAAVSGLAAGVFALSMGTVVSASGTAEAATGADTTLLLHMPSGFRADVTERIAAEFAKITGHMIESEYQRSGTFSKTVTQGTAAGEIDFNVLLTYGRTGETPPGRDVFKYLNNAKGLLEPLSGQFEIAPEFADFAGWAGDKLPAPYMKLMTIAYNPNLIDTADVPKSWAELAQFEGSLALTGRGCHAMRTLASIYDIVGAEKLESIVRIANMPAMETMTDAPRERADRPLCGCGAIKAVMEGNYQVSVGPIACPNIKNAIYDGSLALIWPEEGAVMFPYLLATGKNPSEADLALVDFIATDAGVQEMFLSHGISSTLPGGKVLPFIEENGHQFRFVSMEHKMNPEVHQNIIAIVERNQP